MFCLGIGMKCGILKMQSLKLGHSSAQVPEVHEKDANLARVDKNMFYPSPNSVNGFFRTSSTACIHFIDKTFFAFDLPVDGLFRFIAWPMEVLQRSGQKFGVKVNSS